jgi:hypothetical protein
LGKTKNTSTKSAGKATKARRLRFGPLPKPPEEITVPYALCRDEFKGMSCGEMTRIVLESQAYKEVIGTICAKLDAGRPKPGPNARYTALECETVFLYQRLCGLRSVKEARDRLTGDRAVDARRIFGFEHGRESNASKVRKLRDGIPSEATLSRHRARFGERRRRGAYQRLFHTLLQEHLDFPEFREEVRLTGIDGTTIKTHYECPKVDPKTGTVVNAAKVTCPEGGFVGERAGADKSGHGFNAVIHTTLSALPLGGIIRPLHHSEIDPAIELMESFEHRIAPKLDPTATRLVIADGAYHSHRFRRAAHQASFIERAHKVSHGDNPKSKANAERNNRIRRSIEGYPNWQANGHDELLCKCGQGQVWKEVGMRKGKPVIRTAGDCKNCGRISITAGLWRRGGQNGSDYVRCMPSEPERAAYSFGNPLTFNDPLAEIYGNKRFGNGEGLHGALESRFKLNKGKRWFRRKDQADTDMAICFSIMHALAMWQRRQTHAAAPAAAGPPQPIPLAA